MKRDAPAKRSSRRTDLPIRSRARRYSNGERTGSPRGPIARLYGQTPLRATAVDVPVSFSTVPGVCVAHVRESNDKKSE